MHSQQISQLKGKEQTTSSHWPCLLHLQQAHTLNSASAAGVARGWFVRFLHVFLPTWLNAMLELSVQMDLHNYMRRASFHSVSCQTINF